MICIAHCVLFIYCLFCSTLCSSIFALYVYAYCFYCWYTLSIYFGSHAQEYVHCLVVFIVSPLSLSSFPHCLESNNAIHNSSSLRTAPLNIPPIHLSLSLSFSSPHSTYNSQHIQSFIQKKSNHLKQSKLIRYQAPSRLTKTCLPSNPPSRPLSSLSSPRAMPTC